MVIPLMLIRVEVLFMRNEVVWGKRGNWRGIKKSVNWGVKGKKCGKKKKLAFFFRSHGELRQWTFSNYFDGERYKKGEERGERYCSVT